jgi:hypothetical protein
VKDGFYASQLSSIQASGFAGLGIQDRKKLPGVSDFQKALNIILSDISI